MSAETAGATGPETTTDEVIRGIDLAGRTALVTGASGGLGAETARALASVGARVTLAARDLEKAEAVAEAIRKSTGNHALDLLELELSEPASVRAAAESWLADHEALHLLVNNAGVMACPLGRTKEGYELQFATNHFGHFLFTGLLVPALLRGAPARIVNLSSAGHRMSGVVFEDIHYENRPYDKWEAYGQSKSANVLFSVALNRRLSERGVTANAVHPGMIVTELGRHLSKDDVKELMSRRPAGSEMVWKSVESGAATSVWAAAAPELEGRGGLYLEDCHEAGPKESEEDVDGYAQWAVDPGAAEQLWTLSEKAVGERFDL
jgi:NAD(P)-dependent dehydrogenase (short-subunit alcohol dehydrogenase family)